MRLTSSTANTPGTSSKAAIGLEAIRSQMAGSQLVGLTFSRASAPSSQAALGLEAMRSRMARR